MDMLIRFGVNDKSIFLITENDYLACIVDEVRSLFSHYFVWKFQSQSRVSLPGNEITNRVTVFHSVVITGLVWKLARGVGRLGVDVARPF